MKKFLCLVLLGSAIAAIVFSLPSSCCIAEEDRDFLATVNRQVSDTAFEGNKFFSDANLRLLLRIAPYSISVEDREAWQDAAATILRTEYSQRGFVNVKVEMRFLAASDTPKLLFVIDEGARFHLRRFVIEGVDAELAKVISHYLDWRPRDGQEYYTASLDGRVLSTASTDNNLASFLPESTFKKTTPLQKSQRFIKSLTSFAMDEAHLRKDCDKAITAAAALAGIALLKYELSLNRDEGESFIEPRVIISSFAPLVVSDVQVEGLTRHSMADIKNHLSIEIGDQWSAEYPKRVQRKLFESGRFRYHEVETLFKTGTPNCEVVIRLMEDDLLPKLDEPLTPLQTACCRVACEISSDENPIHSVQMEIKLVDELPPFAEAFIKNDIAKVGAAIQREQIALQIKSKSGERWSFGLDSEAYRGRNTIHDVNYFLPMHLGSSRTIACTLEGKPGLNPFTRSNIASSVLLKSTNSTEPSAYFEFVVAPYALIKCVEHEKWKPYLSEDEGLLIVDQPKIHIEYDVKAKKISSLCFRTLKIDTLFIDSIEIKVPESSVDDFLDNSIAKEQGSSATEVNRSEFAGLYEDVPISYLNQNFPFDELVLLLINAREVTEDLLIGFDSADLAIPWQMYRESNAENGSRSQRPIILGWLPFFQLETLQSEMLISLASSECIVDNSMVTIKDLADDPSFGPLSFELLQHIAGNTSVGDLEELSFEVANFYSRERLESELEYLLNSNPRFAQFIHKICDAIRASPRIVSAFDSYVVKDISVASSLRSLLEYDKPSTIVMARHLSEVIWTLGEGRMRRKAIVEKIVTKHDEKKSKKKNK